MNQGTKVNWNFKNYFITYAQCNITKWAVHCHLSSIFGEYGIIRWAIGRERHQDGNWHLHAIYSLATKLHTRDVRKFDIGTRHPNVKSASEPNTVFGYCTKSDTKWIGNWTAHNAVADDFRKKKADLDAYELEKELQGLISPFPFELPNEILLSKVQESKKRHWWFVSSPDWGKSTWINETFAGKQVYMVPSSKYQWEGYNKEEVCIWDDHFPSREAITSASQIWKIMAQVPGETRYTRVYWPRNLSRLLIVLHNDIPCYIDDPWFRSRFHVYNLNKNTYI